MELKRSTKIQLQLAPKYIVVLLVCAMILTPLMIFLIASFKTVKEFAKTGIMTLAKTPVWDNYATVLERGDFLLAFKNTLIIMVCSITLSVIFGSALAYAMGRFQFRGRGLILMLMMGANVIPGITTQVAKFTIVKGLGLYNTLGAPILLYMGSDVVQLILYIQFVQSIPSELDESALIDGASYWRIFRSIIFPLLTPATMTVVILKIVGIYNDMYTPYLYMPKAKLAVVSTAMMKFCGSNYGAQVPLLAAAFITVMLPMLILYICAQKLLFGGITAGAVKS